MLCEIFYVGGIPICRPQKAFELFGGSDMLLFPLPNGCCLVSAGEAYSCTEQVPDVLHCGAEKKTFFGLDSHAGLLQNQKSQRTAG